MKQTNTPSLVPKESLRRSLGRKLRWSALAMSMAFAAHLDAAPPELKTQGNLIVEKATGTPVRLTGVNIASLEWGVGESIMTTLEVAIGTWQSNIIRLPVKASRWNATNGSQIPYKATVDAFIARASELGVYVILDLHEFEKIKASRDEVFWADAANRYKNNPAVLFGLFNEPKGTTWEVWRNGDSESNGMQGLLNIVRGTGARNIVLAGGLDYGYDLRGILDGYALTDTSTGNGVVYDSHVYPWKKYVQDKVGIVAAQYPVLLGEFGHSNETSSHGTTYDPASVWVPHTMDWVNTNNIHWTGWCFYPGASPAMLVDWSYKPTSYWGEPAKWHLQSYVDPDIKRVVGGNVIGTTGAKGSETSGVRTATRGAVAAFDTSHETYFDAPTASGSWTGLDLLTPRRITQIKYMPRENYGHLMLNGKFEASNSPTFSSGVVTLHTVSVEPNDTITGPRSGTYTTVAVSNTNAYRYVRYVGPPNSRCNVGSILFYTGTSTTSSVNDDVIVIDNGGSGCTSTGTWKNSSPSGYFGNMWVSDDNTNKGGVTMTFTPTIKQAGSYEVYARWSKHPSRTEAAPYYITHANGVDLVEKDQTDEGDDWISLGTFSFNAGTSGKVMLTNAGTTGWVSSDGMMFVRRSAGGATGDPIILDKGSTDGDGVTTQGSWTSSNSVPNYFGERYYHDGNGGKGTKWVRFTPPITTAGEYAVYVRRHDPHSSRATNARVEVNHAGGTALHYVNQREFEGGGGWYLLGNYTFNTGTSGNVRVYNHAADNGHVVADAVMFVPLAAPEDIVMDKEGPDGNGIQTQGSWSSSNSVPNYVGERYYHDGNSGKGTKWVRFTPTITAAGQYAVYVNRHDPHSSRATNAQVEVVHAGGTALHYVNQRTFEGGAGWYLLGNYTFNAGTSGNVRVLNHVNDDGHVVADAVRFLKLD